MDLGKPTGGLEWNQNLGRFTVEIDWQMTEGRTFWTKNYKGKGTIVRENSGALEMARE